MRKRIFRVVACLCAAVTILFCSIGSASAWSTGDMPNVVNWKDHVVSSIYRPDYLSGYDVWEYTSALPIEFIWRAKLHYSTTNIVNLPMTCNGNVNEDYVRYGPSSGDGNYAGFTTGDYDSVYHLEFQAETDYVLSVEDLIPLDNMAMQFTIQNDGTGVNGVTLQVDTIALTFYIRYWDENFNYLYDVAVYTTQRDILMENIRVPFELYTDPTEPQPPYISFIVQYDYYGQCYDWDASKFNWTFHSTYKTADAPDAGGDTGGSTGGDTGGSTGGDTGDSSDSAVEDILNGNSPAVTPDDGGAYDDYESAEDGLMSSIEDGFDSFFSVLQNGLTFLATYSLVFVNIGRLMNQFLGYGWISNLLTVSLSIGIVGVLLGIVPGIMRGGGKK